jgi:L-malate glycosyltransferase
VPADRPRVVVVQRALRRYRGGFYDRLRDTLAAEGVDLELLHSTPAPADDPRDDALEIAWADRLPRRTLRVRGQKLIWQPATEQITTADLVITTQAAELLLNYRLLWRQGRGGPAVAFWGHGRNFAATPNRLAEALKSRASRRVHWWFAYTQLSADAVAELGYPADRVTVVDNAIDTTELADHLAEVTPERVAELREELALGGGPVVLFIGTLRADKRLDVLLDAARQVHAVRPDLRLVIVGAGPAADEVRRLTEGETWVRYLGSRYGRERAELLRLADLLLLPGWVGLVVLDSLVAGTPLVTSAEGPHAPEIAYLRHEQNGLLVPGGSDPGRYAAAIDDLLGRPELLDRLVAGCREDAARYTIEHMVDRFAEGILAALEAPPL